MNNDKDNKSKPDPNKPNVHTPEPPQVMNPSEEPRKHEDDKTSKPKRKRTVKTRSSGEPQRVFVS